MKAKQLNNAKQLLEAVYMRSDMKLMPARVFISGAGLSYCCVYMMSGRYETFVSERHENFMSLFSCRHEKSCRHENGMKISCKQNFFMSGRYENQIDMIIY